MRTMLCAVNIPHESGLPENTVVNTFVLQTADGTVAVNTEAAQLALLDFYNTDHVVGGDDPSLRSIGSLLSDELTHGAAFVNFYDISLHLDGAPHGSPINTLPLPLDPSGGATRLPSEVAACLSFRGEYGTADEDVPAGVPGPKGNVHERARLRGRVFLGPLVATGVSVEGADQAQHISLQARRVIAAAGGRLMADAGTAWLVWSRTNASVVAVSQGWVDDAFDIQRRRGPAALTRSTF